MTLMAFDSLTDKMQDSSAVMAADRLLDLKKKKPFWEVCDEVVKIWSEKQPKVYKAYIVNLKDIKETRRDQKHATSSKSSYNQLRYIVDCPEMIVLVLRQLYGTDDLQMDKEFWMKFASRYPVFRIPDRL